MSPLLMSSQVGVSVCVCLFFILRLEAKSVDSPLPLSEVDIPFHRCQQPHLCMHSRAVALILFSMQLFVPKKRKLTVPAKIMCKLRFYVTLCMA